MKVLIIGAGGAIGSCLSAWLSETKAEAYLYDKPEVMETLKREGITYYQENYEKKHTAVKTVDTLKGFKADVVAIVVKNYSLDAVSKMIAENIKGDPVVIGFQNGVENQKILPKYFKKPAYCIIEFNAWLDKVGCVGYQNKGPFVLGTADNSLQKELKEIADVFSAGAETLVTDRIKDAAYCKMVINLTNSFTTLVGMQYREITNLRAFKRVLTNSMYEGMQIIKKKGVREFKAHTMPSWTKIAFAARMPDFITDGIFKKNLAKMVLSSMAQDIIQRKTGASELESLIGEFITMADSLGMAAPYNRTVYELCKKRFAADPFVPMTEEEVLEEVKKRLK